MTSPELDLVTVIVDDYDAAIAFYTSALGFVVTQDEAATTTDGRAKRWVVLRPPAGGTGLLIAQADGAEQQAVVGRQFAGRVGLFLRVDDVQVALATVLAAGGQLIRPARQEPYGWVAVFRDIAGNDWDLLSRPSSAEPSTS